MANVGDSRCILSSEGTEKVFMLSTDHKPMDEVEQKRINENGGKIYQTQTLARVPGQNPGVQFPAVNPAGKNHA